MDGSAELQLVTEWRRDFLSTAGVKSHSFIANGGYMSCAILQQQIVPESFKRMKEKMSAQSKFLFYFAHHSEEYVVTMVFKSSHMESLLRRS